MAWPALLKALLPHLSLLDTVRISSCSKACCALVVQEIDAGDYSLARRLLYKAARAAAAACRSGLPVNVVIRQATKATMSWLLKKAAIPRALIAADSARYISIANMPLEACTFLVGAGISIDHKELMSAADRSLEGVQYWVEAQRLLGSESAVPELHDAVCCAGSKALQGFDEHQFEMALRDASPATIKELLVVAVNMMATASGPDHQCYRISMVIGTLARAPAATELTPNDVLLILQRAVTATARVSGRMPLPKAVIRSWKYLQRLAFRVQGSLFTAAGVQQTVLTALKQLHLHQQAYRAAKVRKTREAMQQLRHRFQQLYLPQGDSINADE